VRVVMTKAAQEFVTAMSVGRDRGRESPSPSCSIKSEFDVGHIRLARDKRPDRGSLRPQLTSWPRWRNGHADDLATAVLLAADKKNSARAPR